MKQRCARRGLAELDYLASGSGLIAIGEPANCSQISWRGMRSPALGSARSIQTCTIAGRQGHGARFRCFRKGMGPDFARGMGPRHRERVVVVSLDD